MKGMDGVEVVVSRKEDAVHVVRRVAFGCYFW